MEKRMAEKMLLNSQVPYIAFDWETINKRVKYIFLAKKDGWVGIYPVKYGSSQKLYNNICCGYFV